MVESELSAANSISISKRITQGVQKWVDEHPVATQRLALLLAITPPALYWVALTNYFSHDTDMPPGDNPDGIRPVAKPLPPMIPALGTLAGVAVQAKREYDGLIAWHGNRRDLFVQLLESGERVAAAGTIGTYAGGFVGIIGDVLVGTPELNWKEIKRRVGHINTWFIETAENTDQSWLNKHYSDDELGTIKGVANDLITDESIKSPDTKIRLRAKWKLASRVFIPNDNTGLYDTFIRDVVPLQYTEADPNEEVDQYLAALDIATNKENMPADLEQYTAAFIEAAWRTLMAIRFPHALTYAGWRKDKIELEKNSFTNSAVVYDTNLRRYRAFQAGDTADWSVDRLEVILPKHSR